MEQPLIEGVFGEVDGQRAIGRKQTEAALAHPQQGRRRRTRPLLPAHGLDLGRGKAHQRRLLDAQERGRHPPSAVGATA